MHLSYARVRDQAAKIGIPDTRDGGIWEDVQRSLIPQDNLESSKPAEVPTLPRKSQQPPVLEKNAEASTQNMFPLPLLNIGPITMLSSSIIQGECAGLIRKERLYTPKELEVMANKH